MRHVGRARNVLREQLGKLLLPTETLLAELEIGPSLLLTLRVRGP